MKIALIGYGKMGQEIEKIAIERGHEIELIIDIDNRSDLNPEKLKNIDVAIEFTIPSAAIDNFKDCFEGNVPVVTGTTGWLDRFDDIKAICETRQKGLFFAPNFSLGVNVFFKLSEYLAKIMDQLGDYDLDITETHHIHKKDAPSGTAIKLADDILKHIKRKTSWELSDGEVQKDALKIKAIRENNIPGIHTIHYESMVDDILITHSAKSRKGFALGAVLAAEFMKGKQGVYDMNDLLQI